MNSLANNQDYLKNRIHVPKTFEQWLRNIWDDKVIADREPHKIEIVIKKNKSL